MKKFFEYFFMIIGIIVILLFIFVYDDVGICLDHGGVYNEETKVCEMKDKKEVGNLQP